MISSRTARGRVASAVRSATSLSGDLAVALATGEIDVLMDAVERSKAQAVQVVEELAQVKLMLEILHRAEVQQKDG